MKSTSLSTKLIMILLLLAVVGYFAVQGYNYLVSPETTTLVYRYRSEQSIAVRGCVVRKEQVVDCGETLIELKHAEGERVGQGDTIAAVYRSAEALSATQELESLRAQKEQLEYAKSASSDAATALRLDTDIREQIVSVRAAYESGAYSSLDTLIPQLKTTVLKREYAYNGSDNLTARLDELSAQISALSSAASGGTTRITAPVSGTYSAVADGYESVLTPEALETMTPSQLTDIAPQSVSTTVGKLIEGSAWYFAANISEEDAAGLKVGSSLTLRMASGVDFDLPVKLTRISDAENGKCLICEGIERFSKAIQTRDFFTVTKTADGERLLPLPDGCYLVADTENTLRQRMKSDEGYMRSYCKNRFYTGSDIATKLWVGDYQNGDSFHDLAQDAGGIRRLAVLRADIDNLGQAFVSGFESEKHGQKYVTLSRTATFSRKLALFFKLHVVGLYKRISEIRYVVVFYAFSVKRIKAYPCAGSLVVVAENVAYVRYFGKLLYKLSRGSVVASGSRHKLSVFFPYFGDIADVFRTVEY